MADTNLDSLRESHAEALAAGRLTFQRCRACGHAWLPPSEECPSCLSPDHGWEDASGQAQLVSWCTYHRTPLPEFESELPYTVYLVALAEGPRLISGPSEGGAVSGLEIDQPLALEIREIHGQHVPRFRPAGE
jgi:uncharacterized OB-fold protein